MYWHDLRQGPVRLNSLATGGEKEDSWQLKKNERHWKWRRPSNVEGKFLAEETLRPSIQGRRRPKGRLAGDLRSWPPERQRKSS